MSVKEFAIKMIGDIYLSAQKAGDIVYISKIKKRLLACGSNVSIGKNCMMIPEHVSVGSNVSIGYSCSLMASIAHIYIGNNVMLAPGVVIRGGISLGQSCCIEEGTLLQTSNGYIQLGTGVYVNRNCTIGSHENILIGEHTTIGPNVCIYDHDHNYRDPECGIISTPVVIGKGVWIGAGSIILSGTKIGDNCVIAAGSVLKGEIPAATVVVCKHEIITKSIKE